MRMRETNDACASAIANIISGESVAAATRSVTRTAMFSAIICMMTLPWRAAESGI